jgi:hypothetical protein
VRRIADKEEIVRQRIKAGDRYLLWGRTQHHFLNPHSVIQQGFPTALPAGTWIGEHTMSMHRSVVGRLNHRIRYVMIDVGAAVWAASRTFVYAASRKRVEQEGAPAKVPAATEARRAVDAQEVDRGGAWPNCVNQTGIRSPQKELIDECDRDEEGKENEPTSNDATKEQLACRHGCTLFTDEFVGRRDVVRKAMDPVPNGFRRVHGRRSYRSPGAKT